MQYFGARIGGPVRGNPRVRAKRHRWPSGPAAGYRERAHAASPDG